MQGVQAKKVLGYMILPGIIPRAKNLFASGFGYLAFLMASIYGIVKLLPSNHPYLEPQNIGKFGIRHVIGEAANNLVISRKNIDQIIIFTALMVGIVILVMQLALLLYGYVIQPALAQSIFSNGQPERDIAFMMMDRVFGIPGFFKSCVDIGVACTENGPVEPGNLPHAFHAGLHSLFRFYSLGLLVVAAMIFLYFVVVVIGETAVTGTPFGQRFQNVWVPIRLVVALGLLVPINYGLNSGQFITLYAAKIGSNMATNGWLKFNEELGDIGATGETQNNIALPQTPNIAPTVAFMSLAHACAYSYWHQDESKNYVPPMQRDYYTQPMNTIKAYFVKNPSLSGGGGATFQEVTPSTTYQTALDFYDKSDIRIRFGVRDEEKNKQYKGAVEPTCGEINISIVDASTAGGAGPGAVQQYYYELIKNLWHTGGSAQYNLIQISQKYMALYFNDQWISASGAPYYVSCTICGPSDEALMCNGIFVSDNPSCATAELGNNLKTEMVADIQGDLASHIEQIWNDYNLANQSNEKDDEILQYGWGGAGIWYNRINSLNGAFISAVTSVPRPVSYPVIMEEVREQKTSNDSAPAPIDKFDPSFKGERLVDLFESNLAGSDATTIAKGLSSYYKYWYLDGANNISEDSTSTGAVFQDTIHLVFGTSGLMAMRGENAYIHPLAQLTAVGKSLVDSAIINVLGATLDGTMGNLFDKMFGLAKGTAAGLATNIAFIGLTAGFILYYILPFLPFVYFFFAVGGWVKGIFEAMVGVPLWALAHLRLDGEGLPGDSAANGYFLIFEIFVRPILIVVGLVAAVTIFTAQVRVLHSIWPLVLDNLTGYADQYDATILDVGGIVLKRGIIDQFFFTVLYTIIVYMLATASFKLIDQIPDNILRWMGAGVSSFNDINDDATQGLTRYAAVGGLTFGRQLTSSAQQFGQGVGSVLGKEAGQLGELLGTRKK